MSLKDYCKTRDKFEMDPRLSVCSACRHWSIGKRNEPCRTCDHNANAAPAPEGCDIPATLEHDAGAVARCSYCGRYTKQKDVLRRNWARCDCGKTHGWSGSFAKPDGSAIWCEPKYQPVSVEQKGGEG